MISNLFLFSLIFGSHQTIKIINVLVCWAILMVCTFLTVRDKQVLPLASSVLNAKASCYISVGNNGDICSLRFYGFLQL